MKGMGPAKMHGTGALTNMNSLSSSSAASSHVFGSPSAMGRRPLFLLLSNESIGSRCRSRRVTADHVVQQLLRMTAICRLTVQLEQQVADVANASSRSIATNTCRRKTLLKQFVFVSRYGCIRIFCEQLCWRALDQPVIL